MNARMSRITSTVSHVVRVKNVVTPQNFIALNSMKDGAMVGLSVVPMKANVTAETTLGDEQFGD